MSESENLALRYGLEVLSVLSSNVKILSGLAVVVAGATVVVVVVYQVKIYDLILNTFRKIHKVTLKQENKYQSQTSKQS